MNIYFDLILSVCIFLYCVNKITLLNYITNVIEKNYSFNTVRFIVI